ncbi:tRNA-binding protein [Thermoplasma sp.]|uniref:tRNA-binding protein n=1 Tax=Thermoplasma sp. TaxID=1973142 RepID=UPI0012771980|nr:tRNA-binding protein [Thermoplasma sp.]KAA8923003.1 MAG: tRNA-binding protein [Thermoplasma sp.]
MKPKEAIDYGTFSKVDMRVGRIIDVQDFPEAKKPAYKLRIYFGEDIGYKNSSAQITNYRKEELLGMNIIAVVNFPPKQVANFISEVLVLGAITNSGVRLIQADSLSSPGDHIA